MIRDSSVHINDNEFGSEYTPGQMGEWGVVVDVRYNVLRIRWTEMPFPIFGIAHKVSSFDALSVCCNVCYDAMFRP